MLFVLIVLCVRYSNEWYPWDTSKKIQAVFRQKGTSGKHIGNPVFGYLYEHTRGYNLSSSMGQSAGASQE
ncbi:MAG: hypothetical protein LUG23_04315 [Oscillospiraceae bacterium]|nr:hypothetical protein [Oscillospiraceae bacterium]